LFDSKLVQVVIAKVRTEKAPGIDGVTAEHVLNCRPTTTLHLLILFNAILKHNYVPAEFGIGVTVPLLKGDNLDRSNIDNYKAITISPVLSKIFEHCLSFCFNHYFETSDFQCGFKAKVGCNKALFCSALLFSILLVMDKKFPLLQFIGYGKSV